MSAMDIHDSPTHISNHLARKKFHLQPRFTMVNRAFVQEVRTEKNGTHSVILTDGTRLRLSRSRRKLLTDLL